MCSMHAVCIMKRMLPSTKELSALALTPVLCLLLHTYFIEYCDFRTPTNLFGDLDEWFFGCANRAQHTSHSCEFPFRYVHVRYKDISSVSSILVRSVISCGNRLNTGIGPHNFLAGYEAGNEQMITQYTQLFDGQCDNFLQVHWLYQNEQLKKEKSRIFLPFVGDENGFLELREQMPNETRNKGGFLKVFRQGSNESNSRIKSNIFVVVVNRWIQNWISFIRFVAVENFNRQFRA